MGDDICIACCCCCCCECGDCFIESSSSGVVVMVWVVVSMRFGCEAEEDVRNGVAKDVSLIIIRLLPVPSK